MLNILKSKYYRISALKSNEKSNKDYLKLGGTALKRPNIQNYCVLGYFFTMKFILRRINHV